ncbi:hypothetical protein [Brachyspira hyodysenteriae]|uniref:hypothetical protein n=1 Tax=Brachyspira hyodysenteriae TaxID=159 RepID=UPI000C789A1E|nr:hypothetical protein [Brachyspira hyodysenteriae]AUJ48478.1 hypothetical protein BH718_00016 [Brachyspira hyodysenteriae]
MLKKIIITAVCIIAIIFIITCSASITNSTYSLEEDIGDGSFIDPNGSAAEPIIVDQSMISEFIKKHNGVYYSKYEDGSLDMRYIIDGDKIYNGYGTEVIATTKTLSGNKLQIYIKGKTSSVVSGYDMNDEMYTFNFATNRNIYLFANAIFHKRTYSLQKGYDDKMGEPIPELQIEAGNYYYYDYDDTKKYYILISTTGQIYIDEHLNVTYSSAYLQNKLLTLKYNKVGGTTRKQELHFYNERLIFGNTWINNQLQYEALKRYDSFSPYIGVYKSSDGTTTLTVKAEKVELITDGLGIRDTYTPVMVVNTLTIYKYSSRTPTKEYKIVFSDDKTKASYTKPNNGGTIDLIRQ